MNSDPGAPKIHDFMGGDQGNAQVVSAPMISRTYVLSPFNPSPHLSYTRLGAPDDVLPHMFI